MPTLEVSDTKKMLIVLSEYGYWGEELLGPLEELERAGYTFDFVTPTGQRPIALPASMDPTFIDPPLGRAVVSAEVAKKVSFLESPENPLLQNPKNLTNWFPQSPYLSSSSYLREREEYFKKLAMLKHEIDDKYDGILLVGGSGTLIDVANNPRVKDLVRCFYELNKPIAADCYGVTCLAFTSYSDDKNKPIIWGKHVTGHPLAYDYQEGSAFWDREHNKYFETRFATIPLQLILELAVGPDGCFHGNVGQEVSVVVDYPFVTGRSIMDSYMTGQKLKEVLLEGIKRYGW
ncbi:MAG: DJ-1/PfpI family protein [Candidatus Bathyarchaeota archaeon]|nr:DJ-1/PfpI family protein [Candidatus Bathyarchaeota archaeon]